MVNDSAIVSRAVHQPACISTHKGARRGALVLGIKDVHKHEPVGNRQKKEGILKIQYIATSVRYKH